MERQKKSLMKNQKGFTLIEIIAVLVLLGILASVAIPKYFDMQEDAKIKVARSLVASTVQAFATAYNSYMVTGEEPKSINGGSINPFEFCSEFTPATNEIQVICEQDIFVKGGTNTWNDILAVRIRAKDCSASRKKGPGDTVDGCYEFTHKDTNPEVLAKVWTHPSYVD